VKTLITTIAIIAIVYVPAWSQTGKPSSAAELAAYAGADRERVLFEGAKREGKVVWYTSVDLKLSEQIGKAFDHSAPCGPLKPASEIGHPAKGRIVLKVNGKVRQDGDLNQMIWNVPEIISKLSEMVELAPGDIIMTGTPSGVAATVAGDKIECEIEGVGKLSVTIGPPL